MHAIPVIVPTPDFRAGVSTIAAITEAVIRLGRQPAIITVSSSGLLDARNQALRILKSLKLGERPYAFWVDSDIYFADSTERLKRYMIQAESEGVGFVAPYFLLNGNSSLLTERGPIPWSQALEMKDWSPVNAAGLGFYYGPTPVDYVFHTIGTGPNLQGEDVLFFRENKIPLRLAKLRLVSNPHRYFRTRTQFEPLVFKRCDPNPRWRIPTGDIDMF